MFRFRGKLDTRSWLFIPTARVCEIASAVSYEDTSIADEFYSLYERAI